MAIESYRRIVGLGTRVVNGEEHLHPMMAIVHVVDEPGIQARQVQFPDGAAVMITEDDTGELLKQVVVPSYTETLGDAIALTA